MQNKFTHCNVTATIDLVQCAVEVLTVMEDPVVTTIEASPAAVYLAVEDPVTATVVEW